MSLLDGDEILRALDEGEFRLFIQPIVRLADASIVAGEALLRWEHPRRGLVGPAEFIDVAESTGVITDLGAWAIEQGCRLIAELNAEEAFAGFGLHVNVSPQQLVPDLPALVDSSARRHRIDPGLLSLEVTESLLAPDAQSAVRLLREIHDAGVRLAIDDFGTGYSSLARLRHFPVDALKIDRQFVSDLPRGRGSIAVAAAVVALAHALDLDVIAEGLETAEQVEVLQSLGAEVGQGFHFARPQPVDDFRRRAPVQNHFMPAGRGRGTVLVVDDSDVARTIHRTALTIAGFSTAEAADGASALRVARLRPACIVLDMDLPDFDGETVCRRVRADPSLDDCAVVVVTGSANDVDDKLRVLGAGADDYVTKPCAPRELVMRVSTAIDRRRSRPPAQRGA